MSTEFTTKQDQALEPIREALHGTSGPEYWRSLEELAQTEAFQDYVRMEFPEHADKPIGEVTRRNFLQVMGATLALAGATTGCARQVAENIVPYVKPPEEVIPGEALYFASAAVIGGYARGVLVETHMGRPVKLEGLPGHPSSMGRMDSVTQATMLDLYDPDRSSAIKHKGRVDTLDNFSGKIREELDTHRPDGGEGIRLLTGAFTSPSLKASIGAFLAKFPKARWHQWEPAGRSNVYLGARMLFGEFADTTYDFTKADRIVSLDSDFLTMGPGNVRYAHDFAQRRDVEELPAAKAAGHGDAHADAGHGDEHADEHGAEAEAHGDDHGEAPGEHHEMTPLNRLYAFESTPTTTGASADHRFPIKASRIEAIARAMAQKLGVSALAAGTEAVSVEEAAWVDAIVKDLDTHRGSSIIIPGDHQPPVVHALAQAMNFTLGNVGQTVKHIDPVEAHPGSDIESLRALVDDLNAGSVDLLLMHGTNPVYTAPRDLNFAEAMNNAGTRVQFGTYEDETGLLCHWHVPASHFLESWGDALAHDGTATVIQPGIDPLYQVTVSPLEFFSILTDDEPQSGYEIVRSYWQSELGAAGFDAKWKTALANGSVEGSAAWDSSVRPKGNVFGNYAPVESEGLEVIFQPDPTVLDGSFANNAWMQELPKPLTKMTWDNAVIMAYSDAQDAGISNGDLVEVTLGDFMVKGPVWMQPGHAQGAVTLHLGYGRTHAGKVGDGQGFDAYSVRSSDALSIAQGASIRKLGGSYPLARTEEHFNMEGRNLARHVTQAAYEHDSHVVHEGSHAPEPEYTLMNPEKHVWNGYAWGMTIDLNKCTGCNACITACQSENLIPSVGKHEVGMGREMHWIRVDRYYSTGATKFGFNASKIVDTGPENPKTYFQPVPCMQCENALCELVCPVGATQHSKEGLNDMVYNRCIGTRYCSNNCPYKVRRFNFYHYNRTPRGMETKEVYPETLKPMRNPDVTVRSRGVMEKCTYCVQRINLARISSKTEGRSIHDGEIATACQQACPSHAIEFGNINDPNSTVARLKSSHRNYGLLEDLNTRPRTTYLARLTNPNPELEA